MPIGPKGGFPDLREGCFPKEGWPSPPHDHRDDGDGINIRVVWPEQYEELPVIMDANGNVEWLSGVYLIQIMTSNGWRFYIKDNDKTLLDQFLRLSSAGYYGIHEFMRGKSYEEAWKIADDKFYNS